MSHACIEHSIGTELGALARVELQKIAEQHDVSVEALRARLKEVDVEGYTLAGGSYISNGKLQEIGLKLESLTKPSLQEAVRLMEAEGVKEPHETLSALDYGMRWHGLDLESSSISKRKSHKSLSNRCRVPVLVQFPPNFCGFGV